MRLVLPLLAIVLLGACGTTQTQQQVAIVLEATVKSAQTQLDAGNIQEAAVLGHAVQGVDAAFPGVEALMQKIGPEGDDFLNRGALGINRRMRVRVGRNALLRLVGYPVDRAFDILDLVSFDVSFGLGIFANVHATRAIQAGAGFRTKLGVGLLNPRMAGLATEAEAGVAALALGTQTFSGSKVGFPGGLLVSSDSLAGLHSPSEPLYQEYRDYYGIGAAVTAGLFGIDLGVHPVQVADALLGFLFIDFANDDLTTTRGLGFSPAERDLLRNVNDIRRSQVWEGDVDVLPKDEERAESPGEE
jgi:hypothetical protein